MRLSGTAVSPSFSAGASTGAVSVVVLGMGTGAVSLSAGAFAGAFAAFAFVAFLTNGARGGNERTILAGVAASQLFNAAPAESDTAPVPIPSTTTETAPVDAPAETPST